eukprot:CAMPEP_0204371304 /NCGR_PEP_ID=MMETSP0469-20131031/46392_1 /ASSEMBLY_ACC=CAM_ASM_000384 /TAXON_ID=2969 /ORGANISM="Oxyrrhis marina" /LENGTH=304 /DNA_ID=CAMNT_0051361385 /DNA_START=1 /DNA_END=915 /DNA_ORIENTATION=+
MCDARGSQERLDDIEAKLDRLLAAPVVQLDYIPPAVWEFEEDVGSIFQPLNLPTAGHRFEEELPRGKHPIQLYGLGTPNGQKVTVLLEELGVEYDLWIIDIMDLKQFSSGFVQVCPNSKIPAMLDYDVPEGEEPIRVFESGSILLHLATKYGKFIPECLRKRVECMNWLFWQVSGAPHMGGGFGHFFKYAPVKMAYPINRYACETKRLLDVLDKHLAGKVFICGDEVTIADFATMPWIRCIEIAYNAEEFLQTKSYLNIQRWMSTLLAREGVQRGLKMGTCDPSGKVIERHSKEDFDSMVLPPE